MLLEPNIPNQKRVQWGQIFPWIWYGTTRSCLVVSKKQLQKNNLQKRALPIPVEIASSKWSRSMVIERVLLWLQQHSATFLDTLYVSSREFVSAMVILMLMVLPRQGLS